MQLSIWLHGEAGSSLATVRGRDAWALLQLMSAGEKGCTSIDNPAARWSGYIYNLRRLGIEIETVHEHQGGAFPGSHGRYVLRSRVELAEAVA